MPLPTYEEMKRNYPDYSAQEVYRIIGGNVYQLYQENSKAYANACALRLSRAFNYAGRPIVRSSGYYMQQGADHKNYIFRVRDMIKYVKTNYSAPDYILTLNNASKIIRKQKGKTAGTEFNSYEEALRNHKGIIIFYVKGWGDATGHVTLFSYNNAGDLNNKCEDHCYFEHAQIGVNTYKIELWNLN